MFMSYVEENLMKNEEVIYKTTLHWFIFIKPLILFLISFLFSGGTRTVIIIIAILYGISQAINYSTSEFAITNKRVIVKVGFVSRKSLETLLSKVEGINVNQGILGRIMNYGTIVVSGTGGSKDPFKNIENPLNFRKVVQEQI